MNIKHRDNPFIFHFPQGALSSSLVNKGIEPQADLSRKIIFVENFIDDAADLNTKLHIITDDYHKNVPTETVVMTRTEQKNTYVFYPDITGRPLSVYAPDSGTITAKSGGITCRVKGDKAAMTFPAHIWGKDDYITVVSETETPVLKVKYTMDLPKGDFMQRCSDSLF